MSEHDRTQNLRMDCPGCKGKGYIILDEAGNQDICTRCEGSGMIEKEVPYKFETHGHWSDQELAEEFGLPYDEFSGVKSNDSNEE